ATPTDSPGNARPAPRAGGPCCREERKERIYREKKNLLPLPAGPRPTRRNTSTDRGRNVCMVVGSGWRRTRGMAWRAGATWMAGAVVKCALIPVDEAVARGFYPADGPNAFTAEDIQRLKAIFPDGVCDYSQPDVGFPAEWFRR